MYGVSYDRLMITYLTSPFKLSSIVSFYKRMDWDAYLEITSAVPK